jgi:phospholipase C
MHRYICIRAATLFAFGIGALAGSIKDIKHVVLFMQENRAFDHVRNAPVFLVI